MKCIISLDNQEFNIEYISIESEQAFLNYCKLCGTKIEGTDETTQYRIAKNYFDKGRKNE